MADVFGTPQYDISVSTLSDATGALSGVGHYALKGWDGTAPNWTPPSPATAAGQSLLALMSNTSVADKPNAVVLSFAGTGGDAKQAQARVWGFSETPYVNNAEKPDFLGIYLGTLHLTLGTAGAEDIESGATFVDTIAVQEDASPTPPGMCVFGDVNNGVACIRIDTLGFQAIIVEYTCVKFGGDGTNPMTKVGVLWRTI